jgi:hypothetical protein
VLTDLAITVHGHIIFEHLTKAIQQPAMQKDDE